MKKLNSRILSAFMALLLVFSLLPGISFTADAVTVDYQYGSTSAYSKVIKNWGTRGVLATFLSTNAEDFYANTSYESLAALDGSAILAEVHTSDLYQALNSLMTKAHTKTTSYDQTKDLFQYTDCQANGLNSAAISCFYSGNAIGPQWDGQSWNREHVWPNSKGGDGVNEDDIMMLRPTASTINSGRNNTAYGVSEGYYNPYIGAYDVRGDVARIVLYTYVRWGTEEQPVLDNMWGSGGVIESKDVLLDWMEVDPVDTWEMGRNDSVQSITGTRNVFVDYPELAFILFDEDVPVGYDTPSNNGGAVYCDVRFAQNSVVKSVQQVLAGEACTMPAFSGVLPAGYEFVGWSTASVSGTTHKPVVYTPGSKVIVAADTVFNAVLSSFDAASAAKTWTLVTSNSQISVGSEVIIAARDYNFAMSTEQKSNNRGQAAITKSGNALTYDSAVAVFTLETGTISGSYGFNTGSGYLYAVNNSSTYLRTQSSLNNGASFYVTANSDGTCSITSAAYVSSTAGVGNVPMQYNQTGLFSCYPKNTQKDLSLYVAASGDGATTYTTSWDTGSASCSHSNTTTATVPATCTADGSVTVTCNACGEVVSTTVLPAVDHGEEEKEIPATLTQQGYTLLYCDVCGEELGKENYSDPLTDVAGWSLTLGSDLSINFKLDVDESIRSTAQIHIAVANDAKTYPVSALTVHDDGYYYLSVKLAAAQMTETVTVQITNGNDQTEKMPYSVKSYAEVILAGSYSNEMKALVTQMLHYGAAAQTYFNYKLNDLANVGLETPTQSTPQTSNVYKLTGKVDGIDFYGATMMFRDKLAVRCYFTVTGDISTYSFTVNGNTCTPAQKGEQYYIEIGNINPQDLDDVITVKVNNTLTVTYSPMNYIVNMGQKGSDNLKLLVQALYDYHLAAKAYTNSN